VENILKIISTIWIKQGFFGGKLHLQALLYKIDLELRRIRAILCISLIICTNSTGSDHLPIWFIGKAKQPHSLRGLNITALGGYWRSNQKAWMTTILMKEWLFAFYAHIGSHTILLLMDNFKPYLLGVKLAPPPPPNI
jgi:hypothetical protein